MSEIPHSAEASPFGKGPFKWLGGKRRRRRKEEEGIKELVSVDVDVTLFYTIYLIKDVKNNLSSYDL